ncbi:MAG: proteobacterial dedicated sortase system histidine kinase [Candidatus Parabeggiatoa sp. nov. 2]|nr:MAG: proteobacterial dedicated sortase system histidine kinase [Gammaproteobacteria bacterium]
MTLTIRSKVLLLSLTLFSIPYVGYEYVREMEKYLRDNLETSLEDSARALASVLNERPLLFARRLVDTVRDDGELVAHSFKTPIKLDGYIEDWHDYLNKVGDYADKHILKNVGSYSPDSLSFKHLLGKYRSHLYALFIVRDERVVYRDASLMRLDRCDHLQIVMQEPNQQFYRYVVTPEAPGWVNAYKVRVSNRGTFSYHAQTVNRIQGSWREIKDGYLLELRIPLSLIGDRLGFAIADVDDTKQREIKTLIGTSPIQNLKTVGKVFIPSPEIERIIRSLGDTPGRRLWVLDRQQRVLAKSGDLKREFPHHPLNALYSLLLSPASEEFKDDHARASRLEGEEVNSALRGRAETRWHSTSDERAVIVSAAHPVWVNGQVIGAVVVEETSNRIQTVQRQAIANLFNKTLIVFTIVTGLLLAFATHLSVRLRSLRNQAETAIDINGRVTATQIGSTAKDEIGDLSRSFSAILKKLKQYNTYLEGMASKLSHELRTPIAVVRSSLENLEQELEQECQHCESYVYIERAKLGIDRLNTIITRLSEATRLEQALQNAERELFDLTELVGSCVEGYRLAYPNQRFYAELSKTPITSEGAPDLIAQMLDKLISNAVDFSAPDCPIKIKLQMEGKTAHLAVINRGKALPSEMQERLFESMVSLRTQSGTKEPHLGLGLYMVRLIVGYHGGQVRAENNQEAPGAVFTVLLPIRSSEVDNW